MSHTTLLIIDCNPEESTGETLETMLASASAEGKIHREVIVDYCAGEVDERCLKIGAALTFTVLPPGQLTQATALIQLIKKNQPDVPIVVVVEKSQPVEILELLQTGASDFVTPPLRSTDMLPRVWRLLDRGTRREGVVQSLMEKAGMKNLVGEAANFLAEIKKIPLIARCDSRVLISGETGTGKEMCAEPTLDRPIRAG
jgi:DNA-binding NtrC family response regulator